MPFLVHADILTIIYFFGFMIVCGDDTNYRTNYGNGWKIVMLVSMPNGMLNNT